MTETLHGMWRDFASTALGALLSRPGLKGDMQDAAKEAFAIADVMVMEYVFRSHNPADTFSLPSIFTLSHAEREEEGMAQLARLDSWIYEEGDAFLLREGYPTAGVWEIFVSDDIRWIEVLGKHVPLKEAYPLLRSLARAGLGSICRSSVAVESEPGQ